MLIAQLADWTQDMWGAIIGLFGFIPNWGWMIIVFTIVLKLVLSPLDFWQKKMARNNAKKQAALQPELTKIQQKYGANRQILNQKTMELYKREGYNLGGSCAGMLVTLALTMFIFFTLFSGLMGMSRTQILNQYNSMQNDYNEAFCTEFAISEDEIPAKQAELWDPAIEQAKTEQGKTEVDEAVYSRALEIFSADERIVRIQQTVTNAYETKYKQSFLWIKNLWSPDTNSSSFKNYNEFVASSGLYDTPKFKEQTAGKTEEQIKQIKDAYKNQYNFVTFKLQNNYKGVWNGYFVLVVLAAVVTYFSMVISQLQSTKRKKKDGQAMALPAVGGMKVMKFILPILMVVFTIGYSAAFALYIITNSLMSLIISLVILKIFETTEKNQPQQTQVVKPNKYRPAYSRENIVETTATKVEEEDVKIVEPKKSKPMEYRKDFQDKPRK